MKYKSRAISLTYIKHGNTSIISKIFTEEKGLQTFIIKGVRSKNSKKKYLSYARIGEFMLSNSINKFINPTKIPFTFRMYPTIHNY